MPGRSRRGTRTWVGEPACAGSQSVSHSPAAGAECSDRVIWRGLVHAFVAGTVVRWNVDRGNAVERTARCRDRPVTREETHAGAARFPLSRTN